MKILKYLPKSTRKRIRNIKEDVIRYYRINYKGGNSMVPPRRKIFIGPGDFELIGNEFLEYFIKYGNLKSTHDVLDVGSGMGRMAIPLTKFLDKTSTYHGIDIVEDGIKWCNKKIKTRYKNFNFQLVDIYNKFYNPTGKLKGCDFFLEFDDNSFDFVILTSVFTHLLPLDLQNYLKEISRVLKPEGRIFATYFILNKNSKENIKKKSSFFTFPHEYNEYSIEDLNYPERAIGYQETYIRKEYLNNNLKIIEPISFGSWSGLKDYLSFQDILIAYKTAL